ncbi:hypothetical protein [Neptuniibacter sp. QD37_11]|uniref:hypothetical protein n=1 Tax=Neptuniibacter sp. QD37_11 TaxID=3398209 RepID=UPI0039F6453C
MPSHADWVALYPKKLAVMRGFMKDGDKPFFTASNVQRVNQIGFNHAMHVISHGLNAGTIIEISPARFIFIDQKDHRCLIVK